MERKDALPHLVGQKYVERPPIAVRLSDFRGVNWYPEHNQSSVGEEEQLSIG